MREQASQTPIYRDIAPDVHWATGELIELIQECAVRAEQPDRPEFDKQTSNAPTPTAQTFQIPNMGQF